MIPIFEQRTGKGVGHTKRAFSQRFEDLCREHLQEVDFAHSLSFSMTSLTKISGEF